MHAAAITHLRPLFVFLIGTAARMSEALELDWRDVDLEGSRVTFRRTKSRRPGGEQRNVDLVPAVKAALAALPQREGRVFRPAYVAGRKRGETGPAVAHRAPPGTRYRSGPAASQIKTGWAAAWPGAPKLPGEWRGEGQERRFIPAMHPHDLRHTAATWHYAVHHDLLQLQAFGGWSNLNQVQIYAHLLPETYAGAAAEWLGLAPAKPGRKPA